MRIGIFANGHDDKNLEAIKNLLNLFQEKDIQPCVYDRMKQWLPDVGSINAFSATDDLPAKMDILISLGGDGTILSAVNLIKSSGIPVLGINTGRLGFQTSAGHHQLRETVEALVGDRYSMDERSLVQIASDLPLFDETNIALNEFSVLKKDTSSMITIHCHIDGEFLNSYWADGMIVATPTGSTAYSMSGGGPIVLPASGNFILTPIAPHNLNVRPLVIPDDAKLSFEFESRSSELLIALDSRSMIIPREQKIEVKKASFAFQLVRIEGFSYLETLRNKLNWGLDKRN